MRSRKVRSLRSYRRNRLELQLAANALAAPRLSPPSPPSVASIFAATPLGSVFLISDLMTDSQIVEVATRTATASLRGSRFLMIRWNEVRTPPHHPFAIA